MSGSFRWGCQLPTGQGDTAAGYEAGIGFNIPEISSTSQISCIKKKGRRANIANTANAANAIGTANTKDTANATSTANTKHTENSNHSKQSKHNKHRRFETMTDMQDMKPTNGVKIIKATKPAKAKTTAAANDQEKEILRVAAYCRVSTDSDEQENSYEAQCSYYRRYISSNPKWELAGIFADEGITGTMVRNRKQFQAMIRACEDGKIDMIITKSLSRFSRNTVDCLLTVRRLKELGIPVIFEKEGFNTEVTSGEMMLTFMSSFAQQESESISENVKMGLQMNAKAGKGQLNITHFLGYDRGNGPHSMVINPEQAEVVRRIYREYLEGFTPWTIAKRLENDNIPTATGKGHWHRCTIFSILQNEKYCGDLLIQKYYTKDFLTHRTVKNTGKLPQYHVENHHEPIIPKAIFYQVQGEIYRRSVLKQDHVPARYSEANALTSKLICCRCGAALRRQSRQNNTMHEWICCQRTYSKGNDDDQTTLKCELRTVKETDIEDAIIEAFCQLSRKYDQLLRLHAEISSGDIKRIDTLLKDLDAETNALSSTIEEAGITETELIFFRQQAEKHGAERDALYAERAEKANQEVHLRILIEFVKQIFSRHGSMQMHIEHEADRDEPSPAACYDVDDFFERTTHYLSDEHFNRNGQLVKYENVFALRYIDHIVVLDDGYEVYFKAGIKVVV